MTFWIALVLRNAMPFCTIGRFGLVMIKCRRKAIGLFGF